MLQASSFNERAAGETTLPITAQAASADRPSAGVRAWSRARRAVGQLVKRSSDIAFASTTIFLLAPLMGLVALLVSLDGGPILARQPCLGRNGRIFTRLKFRTAIDDVEASFSEYLIYNPAIGTEWTSGQELRFDPRITAIGRVLRAAGLDELPQLLNVLRGDMSVIGREPVPASEADLPGLSVPSSDVRPGLTELSRADIRNWFDLAARSKFQKTPSREAATRSNAPDAVLHRRGAL